jgi:hypothetical protein
VLIRRGRPPSNHDQSGGPTSSAINANKPFAHRCCSANGVCGKNETLRTPEAPPVRPKGMVAYKHHARRLGQDDTAVNAFI